MSWFDRLEPEAGWKSDSGISVVGNGLQLGFKLINITESNKIPDYSKEFGDCAHGQYAEAIQPSFTI